MKRSIMAAVTLAALLVAGCTTSGSEGAGTTTAEAAVNEPPTTGAADDGIEPAGDDGDDGRDGEGGVTEGPGDDATDDRADAPRAEEPAPTTTGGATPGRYVASEGGIERGYDLEFEVSEDGAILHGLVANVLETCDGESTSSTVTVGPELAWDIHADGTFGARYEEPIDGGGAYLTTLEGSFSGTTATGTIRQESAVSGWVCDTYELAFTAELQ